jgi:hypothetical protein
VGVLLLTAVVFEDDLAQCGVTAPAQNDLLLRRAMTIDDLHRTRLTRSALSDHDEALVDLLCQLYQSVGHCYHRSEPYQQMVALYPTLAAAIEDSGRDDLVPHAGLHRPRRSLGSRATPLLWDRSHGEG